MKKIPFNYIIALENPKAVVKTKEGHLVTDLKPNSLYFDPYLLTGNINFKYINEPCEATWKLNGVYGKENGLERFDLELYVPFTSLWDRIKYYLKKS